MVNIYTHKHVEESNPSLLWDSNL